MASKGSVTTTFCAWLGVSGSVRTLWATERLLAWTMAFSLVVGIGLFGALAYLDRLNTLDEAKENLRRTVGLMEGHARIAIEAEGVVLSNMAALLADTEPAALRESAQAWDRLSRLKGEMPAIQSLWILDARGDVALTSVQRDLPRMNFADREYFSVHTGPTDVGTFISPMIWGRVTGGFLFAVSRAVRAPDGTLRAVVESSIDATHFVSFYESLKPVSGASFVLFRDDADVVLRFPLPEQEVRLNSARSPLFATLLKQAPEGVVLARSTLDGVERLGAYKRVAGWPLVVFAGIPLDTVFDGWWARTQRNALLIGGVLTALCGMIGFGIRNVRRERQAEAAAQAANLRLDLVLNAAGAGVFTIDLRTGVVDWGPGIRTIFGFPEDEPARLERWMAVIVPEDRDRVDAIRRATLAERRAHVTFEYRIAHPTLGERWVLAASNVQYAADGTPLRTVGVNFDVTRLKQAEIQAERARDEALAAKDHALRAKAEAERANLAKSKFLAAASHDLRQPVQSLVLLLASVESHARERPALARAVAMMEGALGALNRLLTSLLDVSRLDAGVVAPSPTDLSAADLLRKLDAEYRLRAEQRGLRLRTAVCPAWVRSDPVLLERILRNLLENALQYTREGGILLGCRRRGGKVLLQVFDTGAGIPEDQQETVFEEFFQMHNPGRDQSKGLGLGLAIVKRIARLLGATVGVRSTPGRGSCFTVTLDAVAAPTERAAPARRAVAPSGGALLIIEDDAIVRVGLQMMVEGWGYRVAAAASGEEALVLVAERGVDPDAVVADYRLGEGMNGVQAVLAVRHTFGRPVPAVIVTGDTAPERIQEVHSSGIGILHKPYGAEELRQRLAELLTERTRAAVGGG